VFLAADHTKFGRNAMVRLARVAQIDALFTDRAPPPKLRQALAAAEVALHVAEADPAAEDRVTDDPAAEGRVTDDTAAEGRVTGDTAAA